MSSVSNHKGDRHYAPAADTQATGKKKKCICPLYAYTRYDKMDPHRTEAPHYPEGIKTIYTKDYTPKRADQNKYDFSPIKTAQKSQPMRDNYLTTHKKDYTPKQARSTTPIKNAGRNHTNSGVPMKGNTEYQDMTRDTPELRAYTPVKARKEPAKPVSGFKENTEYQNEYTPKRTAKTALPPGSEEIFRGTAGRPRIGPAEDRTTYRTDYIPKSTGKNDLVDNSTFRGSNWDVRPKIFDGLTIYKKDYVGPEVYACVCPDGEESHHH